MALLMLPALACLPLTRETYMGAEVGRKLGLCPGAGTVIEQPDAEIGMR